MSARNGRRQRKKLEDEPEVKASPKKEEKLKIIEPQIISPTLDNQQDKEVKKPQIEDDVQEKPIDNTTVTENGNNGNNGNGYQGMDHEVEPEAEIELQLQLVDPDIPAETELDTEEQELQKLADDNSDGDSHSSPALIDRCATRRSQTRNIPTPKTPRVCEYDDDKEPLELQIEQNGKLDDEDDKPLVQEETEVVIPTPTPTPPCDDNQEDDVDKEDNCTVPDGELHDVELPEHDLTCASTLSTQVNVGSDVTREIDLSVPDENSFLNTAKDLTVVETLRRMSSRRAIRSSAADYRKTLLKSQAEKHEYVLQQQRVNAEPRIAAIKRKTRSKTPENPKRFKTETSPGFFSYISSPMALFRNRFGGGESMSASTPKLTAYREQEDIQDPELSKIEDASKTSVDKKRCVIM